ncbi:dihydrolipoamide acetyltransferase [Stigmatella hybrida]|uniref:dihydrolipoamide acetyltransferase n=1 Tax=Stigmatella hybrida TaxID=394097 RepID=UPI001CDAAB6D|nr:dihydrolipoamide acetyltransferase [Stigmatella hybrida]
MRCASSTLCLFALLGIGLSLPVSAQEAPAAPAPEAPAAAPAPEAPPAPAPTSPEPAVSAQTAEESFNTRVKTLEEQVVDLKEKIYRSKARLMLLQETVLAGDIASGARAVLIHKNTMGSSFVLESVSYSLDGAPIFTRVNENGELDKPEGFEIFNGRIIPGQHQVSVRLTYRGNGYGVFSYLDGYKFKVQSSYTFSADAGKRTALTVVGFEKGGFTTDLKDRPAVRYDIEVSREPGKAAAPAPEAPLGPTSATGTP